MTGALTRLAYAAFRVLPDAMLRRLLPSALGFDGADAHPLVVPKTPVRLLIAPANYAGQGYAWARAAETLPTVGALSVAIGAAGPYRFPADQQVPASVAAFSRRWRRRERAAVLTGMTHVIVEAGRPLFGTAPEQTAADIAAMQGAGISVALLSHGTDARSPARHARTHRNSPYGADRDADRSGLEGAAARHRDLMAATGLPVYVSTLGLLEDVPDGIWLPVTVDPSRWATGAAVLERRVPVVVHAPSNPQIKGTVDVDRVLTALVSEGIVEYRRLSGVASADIPAAFAAADIVIDQLRLGDYGVAACEAMAAGRVVVGAVDDDVRARVLAETGLTLPIVQADADTLDEVIRGILADPARARAAAAEGPAFVRAVHDGTRAATTLRPFLGV